MLLRYLLDPIYLAPLLGSVCVCVAIAIIGVISYLRSRSLLGETLAHASYPGILLSLWFVSLVFPSFSNAIASLVVVVGATLVSFLAIGFIHFFEKKGGVSSDSSLCFTLSSFFGVGVLLASVIQYRDTPVYQKSQMYLYGSSSTMVLDGFFLYLILALSVIGIVSLCYKEIKIVCFDFFFASTIGINVFLIDVILLFLIAFSIIIGMHSVGLVMVSSMLVAPALFARQLTDRLSVMFFIAGIIGIISGVVGTLFSVEGSKMLSQISNVSLPTGPCIVLSACCLALLGIFFSPKRGVVFCFLRKTLFRFKCLQENLLKVIWRLGGKGADKNTLKQVLRVPFFFLQFVCWYMCYQGWVKKDINQLWFLTEDGERKARHLVRLHRLWEVYLVDYLGLGAERVHHSAEEIEHILTPELEKSLIILLKNPKQDPHNQPIPESILKQDDINERLF